MELSKGPASNLVKIYQKDGMRIGLLFLFMGPGVYAMSVGHPAEDVREKEAGS